MDDMEISTCNQEKLLKQTVDESVRDNTEQPITVPRDRLSKVPQEYIIFQAVSQ